MSKAKGDRRERQSKEILEFADYTAETPNSTPYPQGYGVDFFGCFDFVAFKEGEKPLFGQVKSNGARGIRSFPQDCIDIQFPFEYANVVYFVCYDSEGWRIIKVTEDGSEDIYDGRDNEKNMGDGAKEFMKEYTG